MASLTEETCPCKNRIGKVTLATEFLQAGICKAVTQVCHHNLKTRYWGMWRCSSELPLPPEGVFLRFVQTMEAATVDLLKQAPGSPQHGTIWMVGKSPSTEHKNLCFNNKDRYVHKRYSHGY